MNFDTLWPVLLIVAGIFVPVPRPPFKWMGGLG